MNSILRGFLSLRTTYCLPYLSKRFSIQLDFDGEEDILENSIGNIKLIGINLLETRNKLTEAALDKLISSLKNFYSNDEYVVAVLHGCGKNFCCGVVETEEAFKKSEELIEVSFTPDKKHYVPALMLNNRDKPLIGALKGRVADVGMQIGIMCDLRIVEEFSHFGFKMDDGKTKVPDFVYKKLISYVGVSQAAPLILTSEPWGSSQAFNNGFANFLTPCGCSLGKAIACAQNIKKYSLAEVVENKRALNTFANQMFQI